MCSHVETYSRGLELEIVFYSIEQEIVFYRMRKKDWSLFLFEETLVVSKRLSILAIKYLLFHSLAQSRLGEGFH
jgi:hypothetical protein